MSSSREFLALVNQLLDEVRLQKNLTSEAALADHFGVSVLALYRWRCGQLPKAALVLIPLLLKREQESSLTIN